MYLVNFLSPDVANYNLENGPIEMTQSQLSDTNTTNLKSHDSITFPTKGRECLIHYLLLQKATSYSTQQLSLQFSVLLWLTKWSQHSTLQRLCTPTYHCSNDTFKLLYFFLQQTEDSCCKWKVSFFQRWTAGDKHTHDYVKSHFLLQAKGLLLSNSY